jgi:hypothetical protein
MTKARRLIKSFRLLQWHCERDPRDGAHNSSRMAAAREVVRQQDVAGAKTPGRTVAEADLNLALKSDHVLLRRCIVPVAEITGLRATKGYTLVLLKRRSLGAFAGCIRRRDLLEVRLPSGPVYM